MESQFTAFHLGALVKENSYMLQDDHQHSKKKKKKMTILKFFIKNFRHASMEEVGDNGVTKRGGKIIIFVYSAGKGL